MGTIGRRRVEQALSWEVSRSNLLAAYEDLLARPPRRREARRHALPARLRVIYQSVLGGLGPR
jgi:hypothetical protein